MREGVGRRRLSADTRLTLILASVMALGPLALDMYLPALPAIGAEYGTSAARAQQSVSAYLFGMAVGQLAFGPLTDRFGRKPPLLAGLALFGAASVACAVARSMEVFLALRVAQALGGSAGMVVIRAVIRDHFDELQSARVLSLMMLVMGAAPILAPVAGGWLLVSASWHWIFWLLAAYAIGCGALVVRFLEESHPPHARTGSLGRAAAGMVPLLAERRFLGPALVFMSAFGAFFAYLAGGPFVFIDFFGVPPQHFGWLFGANALGFILTSQLNRRLVAGRGPRRVLGWGAAMLAGAAALLLACALARIGGLWAVFGLLFLVVASLGLIASNASAVAMAPFGDRAGGAASLLGASQAFFGVLASAAVGWIPAHGAVPMTAIIAVCAGVSLAAYLLLVRRERTPS